MTAIKERIDALGRWEEVEAPVQSILHVEDSRIQTMKFWAWKGKNEAFTSSEETFRGSEGT
jgi:hypothetical protein